MKYLLTGYRYKYDFKGVKIGEYSTLIDAQETAKEYMQNNAFHGFVELGIINIESGNHWIMNYIYDEYTGWEQY